MDKEIQFTLVNKLQVSGWTSSPIKVNGDYPKYEVVTFFIRVASQVRPFQLYQEMEAMDDEYETDCDERGVSWNVFAFEGEIPCRIVCRKSDCEYLQTLDDPELVTVKGSLGNPLVKKVRNKKGVDEYAEDLQPTTLFIDSIYLHRHEKLIIGYTEIAIPDTPVCAVIDDFGNMVDYRSMPVSLHQVLQTY